MLDQTPVQIAWVTNDLTATETTLSALLGVPRWFRMAGVHFAPDTCTYRGEPADCVADISLSYAGDMQLEVIAPTSGDSVYSEFLERCGPGLHHICRDVGDSDAFTAVLDDAAQSGAPAVMEGTMPGGMRFAYLSAPQSGVPYLEIAYLPPDIRTYFSYVKDQVSQEKR